MAEDCRPTVCNLFYQQKEFMNIENYYALKKLEWQAIKENEAAIKIQTWFRKWLTVQNLATLNFAATKIQALMRGIIARKMVDEIREERLQAEARRLETEASIKIQAAWRGYASRKTNFDFYKYKDLQRRNSKFTQCVKTLHQLENLANYRDCMSTAENFDSATILQSTMKNLDDPSFLDDILKLSPLHLCTLSSYIEEIAAACQKRGGKLTGKFRLVREVVKTASCGPENNGKTPVSQIIDGWSPKSNPTNPSIERLRASVMAIRSSLEEEDAAALAKKHHLLRTRQIPGVFSDPTTVELTPVEKRMNSLKFYQKLTKIRPKISQNVRIRWPLQRPCCLTKSRARCTSEISADEE